MNQVEYFRILEDKLKQLSKADREEALEYYQEYFAEAGPEREQQAIEELGDPREAARQIICNLAIKKIDESERSVKKGLSSLWVIILAIFAVPIGLPLTLVMVVVILTLVLLLIVVVISLAASSVCVVVAGIAGIMIGVMVLFLSVADGLCIIGACLLMAGIGILFIYGSTTLIGLILRLITRGFKRILQGGRKHEKVS